MAVEKIDKNEDIAIDPDMEIRTETYAVKELRLAGMLGVISQTQVVLHFRNENPELVVKKVYSFKNNPQALTVTIKMQVTKRHSVAVEIPDDKILKIDPTKLMLPGEPLDAGPIVEPITDPAKVFPAESLEPSIAALKESQPITNPARLLNAGSKETADAVIYDEFATLNDEVYFKTLGGANARIAELEKQLEQEKLTNKVIRYEMQGFQTERDEAEKENATLKSAIEKFGNSDEFDWNVLGRIDALETAIKYAITDLPESPDSAKAYLLHVLAPSKNPETKTGEQKEEEQNGN